MSPFLQSQSKHTGLRQAEGAPRNWAFGKNMIHDTFRDDWGIPRFLPWPPPSILLLSSCLILAALLELYVNGLSFLHALTLPEVPCSTPERPCQSSLGHLCLHLAPWTATCFHLFQQYLLTVFFSLVGEHRRVPWRRLANYFRSPVLKFRSCLVHCHFSYVNGIFYPLRTKITIQRCYW